MKSVSGKGVVGIVVSVLCFGLVISPVSAVFISEKCSANVTGRVQSVSLQSEWTVSGRVLDPDGRPASSMTVRVFDHDRVDDDLLGETTTDVSGDFRVIYHERDFREMGEISPGVYITVRDEAGNERYTSRGNIREKAGPSEYFMIQLGE